MQQISNKCKYSLMVVLHQNKHVRPLKLKSVNETGFFHLIVKQINNIKFFKTLI